MTDLEIVLMIALGVMVFLWNAERRKTRNTYVVARIFHDSLLAVARKEMTLMINSEDELVISQVGSDKTITIR